MSSDIDVLAAVVGLVGDVLPVLLPVVLGGHVVLLVVETVRRVVGAEES